MALPMPDLMKNWQDWAHQLIRYLQPKLEPSTIQFTNLTPLTKAQLPPASRPGQLAYILDEAGGAVVAFSDGTSWRRVTDRAVVS